MRHSSSFLRWTTALWALGIAFLIPAIIAAEGTTAVDIIGKTAYDEVHAKGKAVRTRSGPALALLPAHASAEGLCASLVAENPGVVVENASEPSYLSFAAKPLVLGPPGCGRTGAGRNLCRCGPLAPQPRHGHKLGAP
jgi:hypothetical protein